MCAKSLQSYPTLSDPMNCSPPVSPVCEDSLGKNTGVGCLVFLQGISLTQGSNPCLLCLLHWQASSFPRVPARDLLISNSETHCQDRYQGPYCLCFLLRVLWFQVLRFKAFDSFLVNFHVSCKVGLAFFCIWLFSSPSTIFHRDCLFSIVYCLLGHKLTEIKKYVDLFLGSLFCFIKLCVCFYLNIILSWFV